MGNYGAKVSLTGYDVKTANLQQIGFSSTYSIFKVAFSGNLTLSMPARISVNQPSRTVLTFNHALGYIPAFRAYVYVDSSQTKRQSLDVYSAFGLAQTNEVVVRADSSNLYIRGYNFNTSSVSITVYYYVYSDTGT